MMNKDKNSNVSNEARDHEYLAIKKDKPCGNNNSINEPILTGNMCKKKIKYIDGEATIAFSDLNSGNPVIYSPVASKEDEPLIYFNEEERRVIRELFFLCDERLNKNKEGDLFYIFPLFLDCTPEVTYKLYLSAKTKQEQFLENYNNWNVRERIIFYLVVFTTIYNKQHPQDFLGNFPDMQENRNAGYFNFTKDPDEYFRITKGIFKKISKLNSILCFSALFSSFAKYLHAPCIEVLKKNLLIGKRTKLKEVSREAIRQEYVKSYVDALHKKMK